MERTSSLPHNHIIERPAKRKSSHAGGGFSLLPLLVHGSNPNTKLSILFVDEAEADRHRYSYSILLCVHPMTRTPGLRIYRRSF